MSRTFKDVNKKFVDADGRDCGGGRDRRGLRVRASRRSQVCTRSMARTMIDLAIAAAEADAQAQQSSPGRAHGSKSAGRREGRER